MRDRRPIALAALAAWLLATSPAAAGGLAQLHSRPSGAVVLLDGRYAGVTPYRRELPAGLYNVSLNARGYRAKAFRIRLADRRTTQVAVKLTSTARLAALERERAMAAHRARARAAAAREHKRVAAARQARALANARARGHGTLGQAIKARAVAAPPPLRPARIIPLASSTPRRPPGPAGVAPLVAPLVTPPLTPRAALPLSEIEVYSPDWARLPDEPAPSVPAQDLAGWLILLSGLALGGISLAGRAWLARQTPAPSAFPPAGWRGGEGADAEAVAALRLGCWEAAAQAIEEAVEDGAPTGWQAYNLGVARQRQGRPAEAEQAYRAALRVQPDDRDAAFNLATAMEALDDAAAAVIAYRDLLDRRPLDLGALVNLARLYETIGMLDEAGETWACAAKAAPRGAIKSAASSASARLHASRSLARISFKRITAASLGLGTGKTSSGRTWG